jgi:hypothetical protein
MGPTTDSRYPNPESFMKKFRRLLLSSVALVIATALLVLTWTSPGRAQIITSCSKESAENEIRRLLVQWRDRIKPTLPQKEAVRVNDFVSGIPIQSSPDTDVISLDLTEEEERLNIHPQVNRRDWGYAFCGFIFTLAGNTAEDFKSWIDVGFWCFLEAALLQLEPDHLLNVGFHLNNKEAYKDAELVLCYARALDPYDSRVRNNLAHSLASSGERDSAIIEEQMAVALAPDNQWYRAKLDTYLEKAASGPDSGHEPALSPEDGKDQAQRKSQGGYNDDDWRLNLLEATRSFFEEMQTSSYELMIVFRGGDFEGNIFSNRVSEIMRQLEGCVESCGDNNICRCRCDLACAEKLYKAYGHVFATSESKYLKWKRTMFDALNQTISETANIVNDSKQRLTRDQFVQAKRLLKQHQLAVFQAYQGQQAVFPTFLESWHGQYLRWLKNYIDTANLCGKYVGEEIARKKLKLPLKLVLNRKLNEFDKPRCFNFFVGKYTIFQNGTSRLSFDFVNSFTGNLAYNVNTSDFGSGLEVGFSDKLFSKVSDPVPKKALGAFDKVLNHLIKLKVYAQVDSVNSPKAGVATSMKPKPGLLEPKPSEKTVTVYFID